MKCTKKNNDGKEQNKTKRNKYNVKWQQLINRF